MSRTWALPNLCVCVYETWISLKIETVFLQLLISTLMHSIYIVPEKLSVMPKKFNWSETDRTGTYFTSPAIMYGTYLSQHNHPWQKQGRVAGCLWHKRPEPGLDPSHLWKKRKNMGMRRGGEAGRRVAEGESESWRDKERQRQRGWGRQCIGSRWRYRGAYAREVCICVRVF